MVGKGKRERIKNAINGLMRENVLKRSISGSLSDSGILTPESLKYFIYVEICNTKPMIDYVFNTDEEIIIGRERDTSVICIQDPGISRKHARVSGEDGILCLENISSENIIYVKSFPSRIGIYPGQSESILHTDTVVLGGAKLRFYLLRGPEDIVN